MYDVVAMGELLIDFTPYGTSGQGNAVLEVNPGGAPCNVLAMLKKLGHPVAFVGKVGYDHFGSMLRETVRELGIDDTGLVTDPDVHTTLAFVHLDENGDRNFSFCRNPGADMMLSVDDLNEEVIRNAKIFHFGTLSMTSHTVREATKAAIRMAKKSGSLISFDPNLRPPLWESLDTAKDMILYGISKCDILKISEDELEFITGLSDLDAAAKLIAEKYLNIKVMFVTLGKDGSSVYFKGEKAFCKTFDEVKTIDTTGAGDTFCGCMLHHILKTGMDHLTLDILKETILFGNAASSLVTTKKGALKSMPSEEEVLALAKTR